MRKLWILIPIILFSSCRNNGADPDEEVLARVYDNYLYASELTPVIPRGTAVKDSLIIAKNYINNWVLQELLLNQAERNLSDEQMNFEKQLNIYRNSLIIYEYETLLIKQKLDTLISEDELNRYYDNNLAAFILRENIVQVKFVKFIADTVDARLLRRLLESDDPHDKAILDSTCTESAITYYLNDEEWMSFNKFSAMVPIRTLDQENYLRNHRFIEYDEKPFTYYIIIKDYKLINDTSPFGFEKANIKRIILNLRKTELINNMEDEIFDEALNKNSIEIY